MGPFGFYAGEVFADGGGGFFPGIIIDHEEDWGVEQLGLKELVALVEKWRQARGVGPRDGEEGYTEGVVEVVGEILG